MFALHCCVDAQPSLPISNKKLVRIQNSYFQLASALTKTRGKSVDATQRSARTLSYSDFFP